MGAGSGVPVGNGVPVLPDKCGERLLDTMGETGECEAVAATSDAVAATRGRSLFTESRSSSSLSMLEIAMLGLAGDSSCSSVDCW